MDNIKKKLGSKIRELRISRKLTQEKLAEKINLSAKSLSQIELGNNFVSAETLEELCYALNITPEILFNFNIIDTANEDLLKSITSRLEKNPNLLKTIYKIVVALDA